MSSPAMTFSAKHGLRKIESRQNVRVKELRAGLQRGVKTPQGHVAIDSEHLLREAIRSGWRARTVFVRSGGEGLPDPELLGDAEVLLLSPDVFSSAAATRHPQGVAALVEPPRSDSLQLHALPSGALHSTLDRMLDGVPLVAVAAGLQDPGNLGTFVRSAEAFGATGMILLPGTVSLWNAKTLRASAGSAFRLPTLAMAAEEAFAFLRAQGVRLLAAVPRGGSAQEDFSGPVALLVGNEGAGLEEDWVAQADAKVTIPYPGAVESLNAAVAGSVLLYEAARQRQAQPLEAPLPPSGGAKART